MEAEAQQKFLTYSRVEEMELDPGLDTIRYLVSDDAQVYDPVYINYVFPSGGVTWEQVKAEVLDMAVLEMTGKPSWESHEVVVRNMKKRLTVRS